MDTHGYTCFIDFKQNVVCQSTAAQGVNRPVQQNIRICVLYVLKVSYLQFL